MQYKLSTFTDMKRSFLTCAVFLCKNGVKSYKKFNTVIDRYKKIMYNNIDCGISGSDRCPL